MKLPCPLALAPPLVALVAATAAGQSVDAYVAKPRVVVLTDIANEPDDQMSLVRFLVYSNQFDVEGLVATTSTWMRNKVRPDVIRSVLDAYDAYPGRDSSRDTVTGVDGRTYTSDQATIWRWRRAFQNDFAARMDWTVKDAGAANHNPRVVVNGRAGKEPLEKVPGIAHLILAVEDDGTPRLTSYRRVILRIAPASGAEP